MSSEALVERDKKKKKKPGSEGATQPPLDGELAKWIERQFRNGEAPQSIDYYPLHRGRDRENRIASIAIKADERVGAERAVELANDIFSDCQLHCDNLPRTSLSKEGTKTFEVAAINSRNGGTAVPVGTHLLKLYPRVHRPAPADDEDVVDDLNAEDGDALTSRKMVLEVFREITGRTERNNAHVGDIVGSVMVLQKESIQDLFVMVKDLLADSRESNKETRASNRELLDLFKQLSQRDVEKAAVAIDAENASVDREYRRAQMAKDNMWTDVTRAGMLEAVKVLGHLFPGFGQLFVALVSGKPIPPPPQLPGAANGTNGAVSTTPGQAQLPPAPGEKELVDRFIETAEKHKYDNEHTAAEKLFGKDDKDGKVLEPGVFTREQVAILTGVHVGSLNIEALDALLPDSGKPEAMQGAQLALAMAYLTPPMIADISRFLELRKAAKAKKS